MSYGVEIYDTSGTKLIGVDSNLAQFFAFGTGTFVSNQTSDTITVTGLQNTSDFYILLAKEDGTPLFYVGATYSTSKSTNSFTVSRSGHTAAQDYVYTVIKTA